MESEKKNLTKEDLEIQIIKDIKDFKNILYENKLKDKLFRYEVVRLQGHYNAFDPRFRLETGLSEEDYKYIIKEYSNLMERFPEVRSLAINRIEQLNSAYIKQVIDLKGCYRCSGIVRKKLEVHAEDLCENCRKILDQFNSYKKLLDI